MKQIRTLNQGNKMDFFYDTYAIMSLIDGEENYSKYKSNIITTSILNLAELYNIFLRGHGKQTADYWARKLNFNFIEIDKGSIIKAVEFRFINRKKNLSFNFQFHIKIKIP